MSDEERLNEIPYHIGENISIIYIKKSDDYEIKVKCALTGDRVFSLDQSLIEEFSEKDVNYLSDKLFFRDISCWMSRTDIEKIHNGIIKTMEKYKEEVEEFRKRENL